MRAREEACRILETALSLASSGVDEAEVRLCGGDLGVTAFRANQLLPGTQFSAEAIGVRLMHKGRVARSITSDMSSDGVRRLVTRLRTQLQHLPDPTHHFGFADPQSYAEPEAYDPEVEMMRTLERADWAGQALMAALPAELQASGWVSVRQGGLDLDGNPVPYAIANTRGLLAFHAETHVDYRVEMQGPEGRRGVCQRGSFTPAAIDVPHLVERAVERAQAPGAMRALPPGRYPAVLEPAAVAELLSHLGQTVGVADVRAGASFLTAQGPVAPESVTVYDDHMHPLHRGIGFDLDGVARTRVSLIEAGQVGGPVSGWDSAHRYEVEATGHRAYFPSRGACDAASHLVMLGDPSKTPADLCAELGRGLLVSHVSSLALLDPRRLLIAGVTDGIYLVEDGELVSSIQDMSFEVSLLDLLGTLEGRSEVEWAKGSVVPAIRVVFPFG